MAKIVASSVAPGGQEHVCVTLELPNTEAIWIDRIRAELSGGSHHLIVDRRPSDAALNDVAVTCQPTMASDASRLIIAQQKLTTVELPDGVAFKLDPRQRLFLQLHYFNADDSAHDITGTVELFKANPSEGTPLIAQTLFTGGMQINIPARSKGEAKSFYKPMSSAKRRLFALTSHTHRLGVLATIERVADMNAPAATPIHESRDWAEPPLTFFDPPLAFDGSDGLRLTCQYQNDTDEAVRFGVEAQDEMCFMWIYYYDEL